MTPFNAPFADPAQVQAFREMFPPRQRAQLDALIAAAKRGPKGLTRLNPQPKQQPQPLAPIIEAIEDRGFTVEPLAVEPETTNSETDLREVAELSLVASQLEDTEHISVDIETPAMQEEEVA